MAERKQEIKKYTLIGKSEYIESSLCVQQSIQVTFIVHH